jgi:NADH dehydrogenase FAD-containing subunit
VRIFEWRWLLAAIRGGRKMPFDFRTLGQLAAIGRRTGVALVFGFNFSGVHRLVDVGARST